MKSLIYRYTTYANNREVTKIYFLGMPIFKRVIIEKEDKPRRTCGFNVFASDAPGFFQSEFDDEETDE